MCGYRFRSNRNVRHAHRLGPFTLVPTSRNEVNFPGDSFPADLEDGDYLVITLTLLEELPPYKVRPSPDALPGRWMTGTQNHEGIAGVAAAVDYLEAIGRQVGTDDDDDPVRLAMAAIRTHEQDLSRRLLAGLAERPHAPARPRQPGLQDESGRRKNSPGLA